MGEVAGLKRVRFTTSHPIDFTRDIVDAIDAVPALCDHVHLPVQSGSTRVLDAMQREYTREDYLQRISWIKSARREISITTDIIVGFPGETEAEFEATLSLLEQSGTTALLPSSIRRGPTRRRRPWRTAFPEEEKSRRLAVLQEHQKEIQKRLKRAACGTDT